MVEPMSYHQMGSLASQTSLTGAYDEFGQPVNVKSRKSSRPRLPKIKSSPSHGSLSTARSEHSRTDHKRGHSATGTPTSPTFVPDYLLQSTGSTIPSAHAELYPVKQPKKKKSRPKIIPFYSKSSDGEQTPIDLDRPAAQNEGLASLERISSDQNASRPHRADSGSTHHRAYHHRTTSATSNISSAPSNSSRYVHPMRQIPRPYTPPHSYKNSLESDQSSGTPPVPSTYSAKDPFESSGMTTPTSHAPLPSTTATASQRRHKLTNPLHIRTGSGPSSSQTNLTSNAPGTPSSLRHQQSRKPSYDFTSPPLTQDLVSPVSVAGTARSSFETASSLRHGTASSRPFRSRSNTAQTNTSMGTANAGSGPGTDQAATVAALRQKFQEKEAKKERKYAEAEARSAEKELRKHQKREQREREVESRNERRRRERAESGAGTAAGSEKSSIHGLPLGTGTGDEGASSMSGSLPFPSYSASVSGIGGAAYGSLPSQPQSVGQSQMQMQGQAQGLARYDALASSPRLYPSRSRATTGQSGSPVGGAGSTTQSGKYSQSDRHDYVSAGYGIDEHAPDESRKSRQKERKTSGGKGEKVQSQWSLFWFRMRTFWLRLRKKMGGGGNGSSSS